MNYGYGLNTSEMLISLIIEICFGLKHLSDWLNDNAKIVLPIVLIIAVILLIICCILFITIRKYKKQEKRKRLNIGELCVREEIERAIKDKHGYYLINDVYFYNEEKEYYTQIDHVLITPSGVFAIETKYWKGTTYIIDVGKDRYDSSSEIHSALFKGKLIINFNNGTVNLYQQNTNSNVIKQTVQHAVNLQKVISAHTNFVKGILVFVKNDYCKLEFDRMDEENITIISLNILAQLIKEDKIDTIGKIEMRGINSKAIYEALLKYSRQKPNLENQELKKEIQELKKENVRLSGLLKENK